LFSPERRLGLEQPARLAQPRPVDGIADTAAVREARPPAPALDVLAKHLPRLGLLLSSTAVPVWARSRLFLGPIFVATAAATGAAASRLVLVGAGLPAGHPTREALGRVEAGAIATEVALSAINQRRLGGLSPALEQGAAGRLFRGARRAVLAGLGLRLARRAGRVTHHLASVLYLAGGLAFRYAWLAAGRGSAADYGAVARSARRQ
ncbi:MAG TPA: hypothetical protein VE523_09455, partial [Solirubrobacterales bacterium]|nr:hypothetical protein [Solirubrobacterales bacterium]